MKSFLYYRKSSENEKEDVAVVNAETIVKAQELLQNCYFDVDLKYIHEIKTTSGELNNIRIYSEY